MATILQQLLYLYLFLFLGWLFGKLKKDLCAHTGILSFLLVHLFLPSKVFGSFSKNFTVNYITKQYPTILFSVGLLLCIVGGALLISKLLTKKEYEQKVYRYSLTLSNYAYMGYILAEELYGPQGLTDLILFCIPFALYTYTFGYMMLTGKGNPLKRLINPLTGAIVLGILFGLTGLSLPAVITKILTASSACVGPVSMIMTGIVLSGFAFRELILNKVAYVVVAIRLLALPLLVFGVCKLFSLNAILPSALLMAAMPCGLNTIVFPKLVGEDCKTGARLALLSHLFSLLTLPLWLSLL